MMILRVFFMLLFKILTIKIWPIQRFYIPLPSVLVQTMNKKRLILLNLGWFSYSFLFKIMEYQNINKSSNCIVSAPQGAGVTLNSVKSQIMDWDFRLLSDLDEWIKAQLLCRSLPVGIKVVLHRTKLPHSTCYCEVLIKMSDGTEVPVHFVGRYAVLLYVYALRHPEGVKRGAINNNNHELASLYSRIYKRPASEMNIERGHDLDQALSQSRAAIRSALCDESLGGDLAIGRCNRNNDYIAIPFAMNGGRIEMINI